MGAWHAFTTHLTPYGIALLAGYVAAAWLCNRAAREWARHPSRRRSGMRTMQQERGIWDGVALLLVTLALYRQLDAADMIGDAGRSIARARAVYDVRRSYQAVGAIGMAVAALGAMLAFVFTFRRVNPLALTAAGVAFGLVALLGIATISLHQIDAVMRLGFGQANVHTLLEASSVAAIAAVAALYRRQSRIVRR